MHENCSYDKVWMYKRLGFLTDEHQINVAITRAKLGMYIVGEFKNVVLKTTVCFHLH